jgi:uncharacterized repeat protein (TIGR03803 family)
VEKGLDGAPHLVAEKKKGELKLLACFLLLLFGTWAHSAELVFQSVCQFAPSSYGPNARAGLLEGEPGIFYGVTLYGGTNSSGTIFRINSAGVLTYLASFDGTNGLMPWGSMVWGDDGSMYGVARNDRTQTPQEWFLGCGTVFRCTTNGELSLVAAFKGTNGAKPVGPLAKASDGSFYGTTYTGNFGSSIFRVTTNGTITPVAALHSDTGYYPHAGLVRANDGCFYGTAECGGLYGGGTLFKVCDGVLTKVVDFGGSIGDSPVGGLTIGPDGNLYGTTYWGPNVSYGGTIFRLTTNGTYNTVFTFDESTGGQPEACVIQAIDGNFYGSLSSKPGLFRLTAAGVFTRLCSFEGMYAMAPMIIAKDGNFYGCLSDYREMFGTPPAVIFRLVAFPRITSLQQSNLSTTVTWTSFTNGVYQVEYKPSLQSTNWALRLPSITATQNVTTFIDTTPASGFYRVVLLP